VSLPLDWGTLVPLESVIGISASLLFAIVTRLINHEGRFLPKEQGTDLTRRSLVQRNVLMPDNHEMMEFNEHLTDAEITAAICYLDPDLCAEEAGKDTGTVGEIGITLLTALTGALTYIGLYVRDL
jgi:hypothetical protein